MQHLLRRSAVRNIRCVNNGSSNTERILGYRMKRLLLTLATTGLLAGPLAANAVPFGFDCISNNNAANCSTGENQFQLNVLDAGGSVNFTFSNAGPSASSHHGHLFRLAECWSGADSGQHLRQR